MKKILEILLNEPISTIQGLLYALVGVLAYYNVISTDEGGLWIIFILAIFKVFSRDNNFKSPEALLRVGGGVLVTPKKPKKYEQKV
jgi:hypothetical protein